MSIIFERATEKDVDTYLDIERSIDGTPTYLATTSPEEALEEIRNNIAYLIREDGRVIGTVLYQMKAPDHAYISGLAIHHDFQNRGVGRVAMIKVLEELKNVPTIDLATHPDNERAIKLYESLGFTLGERVENYFGDGEPRIIMTLLKQG